MKKKVIFIAILSVAAFLFGSSYLTQYIDESSFIPQVAGLAFIAITVEIGIALFILNHAWKRFTDIPAKLGIDIPKLRLLPVKHNDPFMNYVNNVGYGMVWGIIFLCISLFFHLFALLGMSGIMLGMDDGSAIEMDDTLAISLHIFGSAFFVAGMLVICGIYMAEGMRYISEKRSLFYETGRSSSDIDGATDIRPNPAVLSEGARKTDGN